MGNCASYPKTNEGEAPVPVPVPEPVAEEVKVEQQENKAEENVVEAKTEETPVASADNSLVTLLNEQLEAKEVKAEAPKEEKAQAEDAKPETNEEKPAAKAEN
uniref:EKN n=1 Tax=Glycine max TaxID=3847 RepID=A0A0R0G3E1_SOYBN